MATPIFLPWLTQRYLPRGQDSGSYGMTPDRERKKNPAPILYTYAYHYSRKEGQGTETETARNKRTIYKAMRNEKRHVKESWKCFKSNQQNGTWPEGDGSLLLQQIKFQFQSGRFAVFGPESVSEQLVKVPVHSLRPDSVFEWQKRQHFQFDLTGKAVPCGCLTLLETKVIFYTACYLLLYSKIELKVILLSSLVIMGSVQYHHSRRTYLLRLRGNCSHFRVIQREM